VLTALAALPPSPARDTATRDLTARRTMLASTACDAAGYPGGSGSVERANKLVIEARLTDAGMHWTCDHADVLVGNTIDPAPYAPLVLDCVPNVSDDTFGFALRFVSGPGIGRKAETSPSASQVVVACGLALQDAGTCPVIGWSTAEGGKLGMASDEPPKDRFDTSQRGFVQG